MPMKGPRRSELFAYRVVANVLGVEVRHHDDGREPGAHDADVLYPDGTTAALEVTSLGDPREAEMYSHGTELPVPSSRAWDFRYQIGGVRFRDAERHLPILVALCDRFGVEGPEALPLPLRNAALDWYRARELSLLGFSGVRRTGVAYVLPDGRGGMVGDSLASIGPWLTEQTSDKWFRENAAKLERSGASELHLFVVVMGSGAPFDVVYGLMSGHDVQSAAPCGIEPVTDVWLLSEFGGTVTRWSARSGWTVHRYDAG